MRLQEKYKYLADTIFNEHKKLETRDATLTDDQLEAILEVIMNTMARYSYCGKEELIFVMIRKLNHDF